jgi:CheY-like chemotaxis protein
VETELLRSGHFPTRPAVAEAPEIEGTILVIGVTILVIEDAPFVRDVTCEILREAGYSVLHADSATAARKVFRRYRNRIQLLLCDAVLPDSNGAALARTLRGRSADLKVLMVSGYPRASLRESFDLKSGHEFLQKPYCAASLLAKVQMALQKESPPSQIAQMS